MSVGGKVALLSRKSIIIIKHFQKLNKRTLLVGSEAVRSNEPIIGHCLKH